MQRSTTRTTARAPAGKIRPLRASDLQLFRGHLLRLDAESRRDRFNGVTDDEFVAAYAAKCFAHGTTIIGYIEDGLIRGAAELHELAEPEDFCAEIAFSVERQWQHRGLGSRLFKRLIAHAREIGCKRLRVTTHPQNEVMKALARKFTAKLSFEQGETVGVIDLAEAGALAPKPRRPVSKVAAEVRRDKTAPAEPELTPTAVFIRRVKAVSAFHLAALGLGRSREEFR